MADDPDADGAQPADGTSPWGRTLEEANAMADRLRADGWDVVTVRAAHVVSVDPDEDDADRFGLVYVAPDGVAEALLAAVERGDLHNYKVFRRELGSDLYLLTRLTDPDERVAVLLVGTVDLSMADDLVDAARECGALHTHVELLDGTHLLSVRHDDPSAFFG